MSRVVGTVYLDQGKLAAALTQPGSVAYNAATQVQRLTLNSAKLRAPVDTGAMRNAHIARPLEVSGLKVVGRIEVLSSYAPAVHDGSVPHAIRPRTAKALSWKANGTRVFSRGVWHPGAAARPWLRNALIEQGAKLGFVPRPVRGT